MALRSGSPRAWSGDQVAFLPASVGQISRRVVPADANSACWPLAVLARAPVSSLTCCRISTSRACRAPGVSGGLSVSGAPQAAGGRGRPSPFRAGLVQFLPQNTGVS